MLLAKKAKRKSASEQSLSSGSAAKIFFFRIKEGLLLVSFALSGFLLLALTSYRYDDPAWTHSSIVTSIANKGGRVGAWLSDVLLFFLGYMAYAIPLIICYCAWMTYLHRHRQETPTPFKYPMIAMKLLGMATILAAGSSFVALLFVMPPNTFPHNSGGVVGSMIAYHSLVYLNFIGSIIMIVTLFLIGVTLLTGLSWLILVEKIGLTVWKFSGFLREFSRVTNTLSLLKCRCAELWSRFILVVEVANAKVKSWRKPAGIDQESSETASSKPPMMKSVVSKVHKSPVSDGADMVTETSQQAVPRYKKSKVTPKLSLLDKPNKSKKSELTPGYLEARSREVEQKLADFGVTVKVVSVYPGPVVTRYEMTLAAGTKVNKITALAKDLARSLSVVSVRIVEVIPGKSVIGLELPNECREDVSLHEVIASQQYENARSPLSLALGKDIAGHPVVVDLAKMPHLLVAGTTGSGKSVSLNAMLLSLLYKASPDQLRMILIDPKMLELAVYDGIPHLLTPVVTDMKDAAIALRWCVMEMERRYRLMASLGVRNVAGYNAKVRQAKQKGAPLLDPLYKDIDQEAPELDELPQIVVIADEFADMMVVVGKKVETLIARLAQKARAAGVHLIFATQRPSVDVITGLIKANIPSRIAFQVSSKIDSRTILDQQGADQLLGYGDMLYLAPGTGLPVRVHGAYVSDDEVHRVVSNLKAQAQPDYLNDILSDTALDPSGYTQAAVYGSDAEQDEFYDEAVKFVTETRKVSISSIQRRFKIGYNRSASIVEAMEQSGVVSAMENNGSREVLAPPPVN